MHNISHLIELADAYKAATGIELDKTASHRIFGDSKKLAALKRGGDITVTRFNASLNWLRRNWPEDVALPAGLAGSDHPPANGPAAPAVQARASSAPAKQRVSRRAS